MITLRKLNKTYIVNKKPYQALNNVDLTIQRGEVYGVLGKSGAGKSTLLRCVNLLERPSSGQVIVNNIDLTSLSASELRKERHNIGVIFQHFNLLESRDVFGNIALPLEILGVPANEIHQKVSALLELVDLGDKQHHLPSQLSGGQKQRVGVARALAADPHVLLCDEATSALDSESTKSVLNLLKKINRELGLTILLITHELEVVKQICGRVGVMHQGRLVEEDTTVNIFSNPKNIITRQLVQQSLHLYTPDRTDDALTLKLTFIGNDSEEPLIASLIKNFNVTVNIRQALIENIQDTTVGFTICELTGENSAVQKALQFIQSTSINAEVLHASA